jgi:hypothetical protein
MKSSRENWEASVIGKVTLEESLPGHDSQGSDLDVPNAKPDIPSFW